MQPPRITTSACLDAPLLPPTVGMDVQVARRTRDRSVHDVASWAGVSVADVEAIEAGDEVDRAVMAAVMRAVGLEPPSVPRTTSTVAAVDARHARTMAYLADALSGEVGEVAFPDVMALTRQIGPTDADRPPGGGHSLGLLGNIVLAGFAITHMGLLTSLVLGVFGLLRVGMFDVIVFYLVTLTFCVLLAAVDMFLVSPFVGAPPASPTKRHDVARLRLTAHAVSPRGFVTAVLADGRLDRREFLASSVTSVEVVDEDVDHVTVEVDTLLGPRSLAWLPRSPALSEAVAVWREGTGTIMEGPQ